MLFDTSRAIGVPRPDIASTNNIWLRATHRKGTDTRKSLRRRIHARIGAPSIISGIRSVHRVLVPGDCYFRGSGIHRPNGIGVIPDLVSQVIDNVGILDR
jgi:hypothetical protein